jgi:predicted acyltransferase
MIKQILLSDLVFPFFMFIMGISTYISLRKTEFKRSSDILFKIAKRTFVIFFIGIALSWIGVFIGSWPRACLSHP